MEFLIQPDKKASKLAVLAGSFHPVTRAHLALACAALRVVDEVLFVMPRAFPHKEYEGVDLDRRLAVLQAALASERRFDLGISSGGLFLEIAREVRKGCPAVKRLFFLCGRDAAERVTSWDYQNGPPFESQLEEFELLVAPRQGVFDPPAELRDRVHSLDFAADYDEDSATKVRNLIETGIPWEHLVPEAAVPLVREYYAVQPPFH